MAAKETFNTVIQSVKDSNLNFTMNLTPFSAHITIKSSFIKCYSPPSTPSHPNPSAEYYLLVDENQELLEQIKELQERSQAFADTNKILEDKLSKSEECARKRVGDKIEEIATLKLVMKNKDSEVTSLQKERAVTRKALKDSDKELHNLTQKVENLSDNLKRSKTEINSLKLKN